MVVVEATILIRWSFVWLPLQFTRPCQSSVIPNLHQDLIEWGVEWGEVGRPPLWLRSALASPTHWIGSWSLGCWWPLIVFKPCNLSSKRRYGLSVVSHKRR